MNKCLSQLIKLESDCNDPFKYDFRNFLDFCYREILGFDPPADLVFDVADWMQNLPMSEDDKSRGQVQCQRLTGKSVIVAIFMAWLYYCNPDIKVAIICSTQDFANRMVKFVRSLFDGHELLKHLVPNLAAQNKLDDYKKDQIDTEDRFVCGSRSQRDLDPSCRAFGIFSTFTGIHPDVVISDDVEVPENSMTVLKRERLHEKCKEYESLVMPQGMVMFMGTPQTIESLYLKYLDQRYVLRRWPARYPDLKDESQCKDVAPMLISKLELEDAHAGDPTYPERFTEKQLEVIEAIEGPIMFALQYMLDPTLADQDRFPLKLRDWIVMDVACDMAPSKVMYGTTNPIGRMIDHGGLSNDSLYAPVHIEPEYVPYVRSIMYIDPSGRGQDEVAYCVAHATQGMVFIAAVGGFKGDGTSDAVMRKLARIAWEHGIKEIIVESNFGDGMYSKLLAPEVAKVCRAAVTEVRSSGQKERRIIDVLGPLTRMHRLVVDPRVAKNTDLTYQYTHITYDKGCLLHEDQVEAMSGACAQFIELLQLDPDQVFEKNKKSQAEEIAREFQEAWIKQARMGRSIAIGSGLTYQEQQELRDRVFPKSITQRGTRGWGRA